MAKNFYIETDRLTAYDRLFRFYYSEDEKGTVNFNKIVDPATGEQVLIHDLIGNADESFILNITTAHLAPYNKIYTD